MNAYRTGVLATAVAVAVAVAALLFGVAFTENGATPQVVGGLVISGVGVALAIRNLRRLRRLTQPQLTDAELEQAARDILARMAEASAAQPAVPSPPPVPPPAKRPKRAYKPRRKKPLEPPPQGRRLPKVKPDEEGV